MIRTIAIVAAALTAVHAAAQERRSPARELLAPASMTLRIPVPEERHLENGITALMFEDRRTPLVSFRIALGGVGFLSDPPLHPGLGGAVMSNLREVSFAKSKFAGRLEALGGATLGAAVGPSAANVSGEGFVDDFAELLQAAAAILTSSINANTLETHLARARVQATRPGELVNLMGRRLFPAEPASDAVFEVASRFVRERLWQSQIYVAVSGPLSPDEMFSIIKTVFGSWAPRAGLPPTLVRAEVRPRVILIPTEGAQTGFAVGSAIADQRSADAPALLVLNEVLGAVGAGRLFRDLRERRGWAYSPDSRIVWANAASYFAATMSVNPERLPDTVSATLAEMARLRSEYVPTEELEAKKRSLIASAPVIESRASLQSAHVTLRLNGLPADYWANYSTGIAAVTAEQVRDVARRYLDPSRLVFLMMGDVKAAQAAASVIGLTIEK